MKIHQILSEHVDDAAIKQWMDDHAIDNYEIHEDNTVTINGASPKTVYLSSNSSIPFTAIRAVNGSIKLECDGNSSSRLNRFILSAKYGTVKVTINNPAPLLSLAKIKGTSRIHVEIWGKQENGTYGKLGQLGDKMSMQINQVRDGQLDIMDLQEMWIDSGLHEYARV